MFIFECFALFARCVGDAFWCLLCLDSLLLATAQVIGYLLCEFASCGGGELGEELPHRRIPTGTGVDAAELPREGSWPGPAEA